MSAITWAAKGEALVEALERVDAELNNAGLPTYSALLAALDACQAANGISEQRAANKAARSILRSARGAVRTDGNLPDDDPKLVEIAIKLARQNRDWSGQQIKEAALSEYHAA